MITHLKNVLKYIVVFILLFVACFLINRNIVIKGLYQDDLFNWSWFPGMNIFDFSFGFYSESRYRPFFNILQYIEYVFAGNNPIRFTFFNFFTNVLLATFIYHFSKKLKAGFIVSFIVSVLYLFSHFAYYQIGQVFGLLETEAQFFALLTLYLSFKLVGIIEKKSTIFTTIGLYIVFFILSFTHERYLSLAPIVLIALIFASGYKDETKILKQKIISVLIFIFIVVAIAAIRFIAVGKIVPAGTGGTYVEETFNFMEAFTNCFKQLAFIFGINIGPEHLVGIEFSAIPDTLIKYLGIASIGFIAVIFIIYLIVKINNKSLDEKRYPWLPDILFILFIIMCIGASSVTIRIEMRFIYASFTACLLYMAYVCGYIFDKKKTILSIVFTLLVILFAGTRVPLELTYRSYFNKVHCIVDQMRMNSLYDNTIGVYGVDDILHNKKIYILNNFYGMTDFYARAYFQIYDKKNEGNKIIFINDISELPSDANDENSIVLIEDMANNAYLRYNIG